MWGHQIEGYICQSTSGGRSPSEILSQYFNKPVHLVVKGGRPRACDPTPSFPSLSATAVFQDGYPLLVASDEDADAIQEQLQRYIGKQGVDEKWRTDKVAIERCALPLLSRRSDIHLLSTQGSALILCFVEPVPFQRIYGKKSRYRGTWSLRRRRPGFCSFLNASDV